MSRKLSLLSSSSSVNVRFEPSGSRGPQNGPLAQLLD